ncbi:HPr(Ser) kinase/phosphatase, partial [bacterium]
MLASLLCSILISMTAIKIHKLFTELRDTLELTVYAGREGLMRSLTSKYINRPSMALMGWYKVFACERVQVLGKTEITYLNDLPKEKLYETLEKLFTYEDDKGRRIPCIIISRGLEPPAIFAKLADEYNVPILISRLQTTELMSRLSRWLELFFAPTITVHGTMVDVLGVGILFTGKSGVGKSECALDLIERGHRLIADDIVVIKRIGTNVLMAYPTDVQGHYIEIRGLGLIDIEKLFGIRAIRLQKRVEINIHLVFWNELDECERLGITERYTSFLNVEIPKIIIPVSPGKNLTSITEVIATNFKIRTFGENLAKSFIDR